MNITTNYFQKLQICAAILIIYVLLDVARYDDDLNTSHSTAFQSRTKTLKNANKIEEESNRSNFYSVSVELSKQENEPNILDIKCVEFKNGGIVVFFHNPKTGGTNFQERIGELQNIKYHLVTGRKLWRKARNRFDKLFQNKALLKGNIHVLEIHGYAPSFVSLQKELLAWRKLARKNSIPHFFFTLVRDPVDWEISLSNHFLNAMNDTKTVMLNSLMFNPQCSFYVHGWTFSFDNPALSREANAYECSLLINKQLPENFHWIGITKQYSKVINIFSMLLGQEISLEKTKVNSASSKPNKILKRESLSAQEIDIIKNHSLFDYILLDFAETLSSFDSLLRNTCH